MTDRPTNRTYAGGYVVRYPTKADLATRPPLTLTERDRQILATLADFGVLPTEIITRVFFPPASGARTSPATVAYERLRLLWLWSLVARIEPPVARTLGRKPFLYGLAPKGVPWVPEHRWTGEGPARRRPLDRLDERLLDHDLTLATFWAHLVTAVRGTDATLERWVGETTLRAWREEARATREGWAPAALADGIAEIRYPDDTLQCCLVEVDMGTETLRRFARKVRGFEAYWLSPHFRDHFGYADFEVVVVSPSARRRDHLRRVAQRIVAPVRAGFYRFGTAKALESTAAAPCWVDLRNHWSPLLDPDANLGRAGPTSAELHDRPGKTRGGGKTRIQDGKP